MSQREVMSAEKKRVERLRGELKEAEEREREKEESDAKLVKEMEEKLAEYEYKVLESGEQEMVVDGLRYVAPSNWNYWYHWKPWERKGGVPIWAREPERERKRREEEKRREERRVAEEATYRAIMSRDATDLLSDSGSEPGRELDQFSGGGGIEERDDIEVIEGIGLTADSNIRIKQEEDGEEEKETDEGKSLLPLMEYLDGKFQSLEGKMDAKLRALDEKLEMLGETVHGYGWDALTESLTKVVKEIAEKHMENEVSKVKEAEEKVSDEEHKDGAIPSPSHQQMQTVSIVFDTKHQRGVMKQMMQREREESEAVKEAQNKREQAELRVSSLLTD